MKRIVLVYLPFCTPASPPYSITNLYSFLKANSGHELTVLDLNATFHELKFPEFKQYYQQGKWDEYDQQTKQYAKESKHTYSQNNKQVVHGEKPEYFEELLNDILKNKPDVVVFSIVYSSQAFYAHALLEELQHHKIETIVGGPSVNEKLASLADKQLKNEIELLNHLEGRIKGHDELQFKVPLDFSIYQPDAYFTPELVIPLKATTTCYYQKCTFCTHFAKTQYYEYPLESIVETIKKSGQTRFFFIDDMIPTKRLLEIAEAIKPLNVKWACQLKPTKTLTKENLQLLKDAGLSMVLWGVESGNQRILNLMKKGSDIETIEQTLQWSHEVGIKNVTYIMFGFPTETEAEFLDTVNLLKTNEQYIDLISYSVFGLQKGSAMYNNPEDYGLVNIKEQPRTVLGPKISYETTQGLTKQQIIKLKKQYQTVIENIDKFPHQMNFFREHMICLL